MLNLISRFPVAILNILNDDDNLWIRVTAPLSTTVLVTVLAAIVPYAIEKFPVKFLLWTMGPFIWALLSIYLSSEFYQEARKKGKLHIEGKSALFNIVKISGFAICVVSCTLIVLAIIVGFIVLYKPTNPQGINLLLIAVTGLVALISRLFFPFLFFDYIKLPIGHQARPFMAFHTELVVECWLVCHF